MRLIFIICVFVFQQQSLTLVKNNGDQIELTDVKIYQKANAPAADALYFSYRGKEGKIEMSNLKRISFKETMHKKKGVTTYRAILVEKNNDKLEVSIDFVRVEGMNEDGKVESMGLSSVDKISF